MNVPYIINDDTGKVLETPHHDERLPDGTVVGVQVVGGVKRYLSRRPTESGKKIYSALPRFGDVFPIIPKSEWSARIKEKKERKTRVIDQQNFKAHDQNGFPSCWRNGPAHAATTRRVMDGLPYVEISAMSLCPEHSPHTGGDEYDAGQALVKYGGASVDVWGNNDSNMRLTDTDPVKQSRKHHVLSAMYSLNSDEEFATACLMTPQFTIAMAFNRWSHVISGGDLDEPESGVFGMIDRNNWGESYGYKNAFGFGGYNFFQFGGWSPSSGFALGPMTLSQL
jgi:hypothetical protein